MTRGRALRALFGVLLAGCTPPKVAPEPTPPREPEARPPPTAAASASASASVVASASASAPPPPVTKPGPLPAAPDHLDAKVPVFGWLPPFADCAIFAEPEVPATINIPSIKGSTKKPNPKAHPARIRKTLGKCGAAEKAAELAGAKTYGQVVYAFYSGGTRLTAAEVESKLVPIDTPERASLWLLVRGVPSAWYASKNGSYAQPTSADWASSTCFGCDMHEYRVDPAGIEMFTLEDRVLSSKGCHTTIGYFRTVVRVATDGKLTPIAETPIGAHMGFCIGRAHEGYSPKRAVHDAQSYFAELARDEAASVVSFRRLARELRAHDAPTELIARAERAACDEQRHAAMMSERARCGVPEFGGDLPVRPLEEIARENAVEGCVRETYAALVAYHQSVHARDPKLRAMMASIADDEAEHAELAHDVDAWCRARGIDTRAARDAAAAELFDVARVPPARWRLEAGEPAAEVARSLLDGLRRTLWT